jgi:hypothetical protein
MGQAEPEIVVPMVQLPESSDEFGDSREIDPAAATSAVGRVFEFVTASAEILGTEMYEELGDQGRSVEGDWAIVRSGVPSDIAHTEREGDDWRAHVVPSDFADAEREEGDAWRDHMAVGGQIEEGLSRIVDLFSKAYHDSSNVSVLFVHFRYCEFAFLSCLFTRLPIYSNCCPCRGRRTRS